MTKSQTERSPRFLNLGETRECLTGALCTMFTPPVEDAAARCPVEPGTLWVFNWGGIRRLFHWDLPRSPISVLKRLPGKQGSDLFIMIRQKMSGNTTQMRGINAQYE